MKRNILAVIAVIVIAVLIIIFWPRSNSSIDTDNGTTTTTTEEDMSSMEYVSNKYGYRFNYPSDRDVYEYTTDSQVVGTVEGESVDPDVAITIQTSENLDLEYEGFEDFAVDRLELMCAADGPHLSISCSGVDSMKRFTTASGIVGTIYYLTQEETNLEIQEVATTRKGPFYVFNISANTPGTMTALVVHAPIATPDDEVNETLIESVAQTVALDKVESR